MSSVTVRTVPRSRIETAPSTAPDLNDPTWFLDRIDVQRGVAFLTRTHRAALAEAVFLDPRWDHGGAEQGVVPLSQIRAFQPLNPPPAMIWHSAFCCSTLMASCLDQPGVSLGLKEPMALVDLHAARLKSPKSVDEPLITGALALLGRGFTPGERVVIKPNNAANPLMASAARAGGPMLLLYSSCRDFVLSVASGGPEVAGGEVRRKFARALLVERLLAGGPGARWRLQDLGAVSDLQAAALLWHVQMAEFRAVGSAVGPARARSLDCDLFLANPARSLEHIDRLLDLGLDADRIDAIVKGPKLSRYAKQPAEGFDAAKRREGLTRVEAALGTWLDPLIAWSYEVFPDTPAGDPVGAPLLGRVS